MKKHAFERALSPGIPLLESAEFFYRIKNAWVAPEQEKTAGDLIQFPGKLERVVRQGKKGIGETVKSLVGKAGKTLGSMSPEAQLTLGGGAVGAGLGGLSSAASVHGMTNDQRQQATENSGPIGRKMLEHPFLSGALLGGASTAGGIHTVTKMHQAGHHGMALPAGLAAAVAPGVGVTAADSLLKRREKQASAGFLSGLRKLGYAGAVEPGFGNDPSAAPTPQTEPMAVPTPSMDNVGDQPPMDHTPGTAHQLSPVNYIEAEETARRAQESNESSFYRDQAQSASGQVQSMGAQIQDVQAQLDQLSQQSEQAQSQVMAANQQAVQANDNMLNQATLAARMRMGMQQLRAQMMEIASQDPEQLAAAAGGPTPMDVGQQAQSAAAAGAGGAAAAPGADPAAAGLNGETEVTGDPSVAGGAGAQPTTTDGAPSAGAAPGTPPGGSGAPDSGTSAPSEPQRSSGEGDKKDGAETTVSIKKGSADGVTKIASMLSEIKQTLPYMAAGGAIGAGKAYMDAKGGKQLPELQDQVDVLKGNQDGGFGKTLELAKAQMALGKAEEARANPARAALSGGLAGAGIGGGLGMAVPAAIAGGKKLLNNINTYRNI